MQSIAPKPSFTNPASKLLFLGGGNMAKSIIQGLILNGYDPQLIYVVDRNEHKRVFFAENLHTHTSGNIEDFLSMADIIFIAIKPQSADEACCLLHNKLQRHPLLIVSIMAGITTTRLAQLLGDHLSIIRVMPNTPALIQAGTTGMFANSHATHEQKTMVETMMNTIGITAWLTQESQMNMITALSGSGPAYYFYFIEIMRDIAIKNGIPPQVAKDFAIQTAYGAAKLALNSTEDVKQLRASVTSKNGTTAAALQVMQDLGLNMLLEKALLAANNRAKELCEHF